MPPLTSESEAVDEEPLLVVVVPLRIGTRANRPAASAVPIDSVRTLPSTTPGIAAGGKMPTRSSTDTPAQARRGLIRAPDRGREALAEGLGGGEGQLRQREGAALHDRPLEEPSGTARDEVGEDGQATGRLARDGHLVRVAAEPRDVLLHPAQGCLLIHQPVVAGRRHPGDDASAGCERKPRAPSR